MGNFQVHTFWVLVLVWVPSRDRVRNLSEKKRLSFELWILKVMFLASLRFSVGYYIDRGTVQNKNETTKFVFLDCPQNT